MPESNDLKTAVVSVWQEGDDKDEFVGTAFFISDSLLLTAKHVVNSKEPLVSFYLVVQSAPKLVIEEKNIYRHPEEDIALIQLGIPEEIAWAKLDLEKRPHQGETCGIFGFSSKTRAFDLHKNHTIGTVDHDNQRYICDHQVLPGFSGGAVAIDNRVMAIVTQRHPQEQQTKILPLFLIKDWLEGINQTIKCPVLGKYFLTPLSTNDSQKIEIYRTLQELAIFVERPKEAYELILQKLRLCENQICAYLCLFTKKLDDKPDDYVRALAIKLQEQLGSKRDSILDIIGRDHFESI